jgi:hypothetical protein
LDLLHRAEPRRNVPVTFPLELTVYHCFPPVDLRAKAPIWAGVAPRHPLVFGLSAFGDLFLCTGDQRETALLTTTHPQVVPLRCDALQDFERVFLADPKVQEDVLRASDFEILVTRLGSLSLEECFYPVPYPALGGSGALETYEKGDAWVHLHIYGQVMGLAA